MIGSRTNDIRDLAAFYDPKTPNVETSRLFIIYSFIIYYDDLVNLLNKFDIKSSNLARII